MIKKEAKRCCDFCYGTYLPHKCLNCKCEKKKMRTGILIDLITFTGVDERTSLDKVQSIVAHYPRAEFAVLLGTRSGEPGSPIFPEQWVASALKMQGKQFHFSTAIHLCGKYARAVMSPEGPGKELLSLCDGFGRVQINLHADYFGDEPIEVAANAVMRFADHVDAGSVILQHRGENWEDVPVRHQRVEYLFDVSEGQGIESFSQWPTPDPEMKRTGYCGGISPDNIGRAVAFAERYAEHTLWFDMESAIRKDGWMDLRLVENICMQVWGG